MRTQRYTCLLIAASVLASTLSLVACGAQSVQEAQVETLPTAAATVAVPTPQPQSVTIMTTGVVQAAHPALTLVSQASGQVLQVHVQQGDVVRTGDPIASLDDRLAQDQVARAELDLQRAQINLDVLSQAPDAAQLAAARASLAASQAELARLTKPPTEQQLSAAKGNLASAQAALEDLLASGDPGSTQIVIAERQLEQAKNALWGAQIQRDTACGMVGRGGRQADCDMGNASVQSSEESVRIAELTLADLRKGPRVQAVSSARAQVAGAEVELASLLAGASTESIAAAKANVTQAQAALDALLAGASATDVRLAETSVAMAELALQNAKRDLEAVEILASAAGTVMTLAVVPGTWVGTGSPIATLEDLALLEFVTTNLSERDVALLATGQAAAVTLKAFPAQPLDTHVVRIGDLAGELIGDAATFPVVLGLNASALDIRPGMTGRAEITSHE